MEKVDFCSVKKQGNNLVLTVMESARVFTYLTSVHSTSWGAVLMWESVVGTPANKRPDTLLLLCQLEAVVQVKLWSLLLSVFISLAWQPRLTRVLGMAVTCCHLPRWHWHWSCFECLRLSRGETGLPLPAHTPTGRSGLDRHQVSEVTI